MAVPLLTKFLSIQTGLNFRRVAAADRWIKEISTAKHKVSLKKVTLVFLLKI